MNGFVHTVGPVVTRSEFEREAVMVGKLTRNDMLSASIIPVVLNASPWRTQNSLLFEMIQRDAGEAVEDFDAGEAAWWGNHLEHTIGNESARRLNLTDVQLEFDAAFQHPDLPLAASIDGLGVGDGIVESDPARGIYVINAKQINITGPGLLEIKNTSATPESEPARFRGPLAGTSAAYVPPDSEMAGGLRAVSGHRIADISVSPRRHRAAADSRRRAGF